MTSHQPTISNGERIDEFERFHVEPWVDWIGGHVARRTRLWRWLGDYETRLLAREIGELEVSAPIFVGGLARSGSTILLECLDSHPDTVSHRYRDYPGVLAPVLWDRISARAYANRSAPVERAHGDGITVTPDSPEAIEEMLWMAFYPGAHDPGRDNSMRRGGVDGRFADFYRDHIRKLLWLRQGSRYLSKNNYNLARLDGLIELFPDARVIVPVREPVTHIASLMRQHALFSAAETRHPAAQRYMQRVGHYEFGLDRRPLNVGDAQTTLAVCNLWRDGHEVEGWSLYWANLHEYLANALQENAALHDATLVVRFEDLCADPQGMLSRMFAHARLSADSAWIAKMAQRIRAPSYYDVPFGEQELATIRQLTSKAAERLGYRSGTGHRAVA
jgi:hypothetical protein